MWGLAGWRYREVLPYFKKLESSWRGPSIYHGTEGPVGNVPVGAPAAFFSELERAAINAGLTACADHNGAEQLGISRIEVTTNSGRRASTARAYLHPAMKTRRNLFVLTDAQTTRIVLDRKRAVDVEYLRDGKLERVHATREIVLCAGPYNSPQLLMLSGIGPADHLRSVGIDVVHDLKGVGENLQEHPNLLNIYRESGKLGLTPHLRVDRATLAVMRWALFGAGPFATAGTMANIFMRTRPELARPDVQIIAMPVHQYAELWFPLLTKPPVYAFTARVGILHALSRGWVRLRSSNPLDYPRIRFNMFTSQTDMDLMIKAVKISREIFSQAPIRNRIAEELLPGKQFQSDSELAQAIRQQAEHRHHAVGTCRMGTDEYAVVDAQLRVIGIENLRVADASVMPNDPSGNTNVPTMMIGEKAADLLRARTLPPAEV
jgi:choline dehydrogenase